ncbi:MAG: hypothetical protein WBI29_02190 [Candidatus Saccharimonadales bacterium]|jgi:hypothetical protein
MKKSDVAMIVLIASISVVIAFFIAQSIFGSIDESTATVKTIDKIESSVTEPGSNIFNKSAINPTVEVQIRSDDSPENQ